MFRAPLCPAITGFLQNTQYEIMQHTYRDEFVTIGLLCGTYGVFTVLSIMSIYALLKQHSGKIQLTSVVLCLTILAFFTSTTAYVVISMIYYHSNFMNDLLSAGSNLWYFEPCWPSFDQTVLAQEDSSLELIQACASSASLAINVTLGDAIVCWRACVVWHKNRNVKLVCGAFLVLTFVLGMVDTGQSCYHQTYNMANIGTNNEVNGGLFEGIPVGIAACFLSLSTNILATVLVGTKAWQSRRRFKGYLVAKVGGSRVEKLLTLLIESGAIYSAIWLAVVIFQISEYQHKSTDDDSFLSQRFIDYFGVLLNGVLVPGIAIYPTIIIVLVAVNKSHIERGISQHLEAVPTPHIALEAETIYTNLDEGQLPTSSEIIVIDRPKSVCRSALELKDYRSGVDEEWKSERITAPAGQLQLKR